MIRMLFFKLLGDSLHTGLNRDKCHGYPNNSSMIHVFFLLVYNKPFKEEVDNKMG